jgi:AAA domain
VNGTQSAVPVCNDSVRHEVRRTLAALYPPTQIVELRVPKSGSDKTLAGWFDDHDKLADAVVSLSGTKPAVYLTLNPVSPEFEVNPEHIKRVAPCATTTCDSDSASRRWLLIDIDPERKTKVSATDAEKEAALQTTRAVNQFLADNGFPQPVSADSGNGYHLIYPCELPNTKEVTDVVRAFLKALAERFDTDAVKIDQTVYNASRITKAYGSLVGKGENTVERPHRMSRLRVIPEHLAPVTLDQLKDVASRCVAGVGSVPHASSSLKPIVAKEIKPKSVTDIKITPEKVEDFLTFYDIEHGDAKDSTDGLMWSVSCPWKDNHTDGRDEAFVFLNDNKLGFKCHHAHCANQHWQEYRIHFEGMTGGKFWFKDNNPTSVVPASAQPKGMFIKRKASEVQPVAINWLWDSRIAGGKLNLFCGHPGMGKGLATMDIAARVSTGTDFPDAPNPNGARKVLIFSSEDGAEDTLVPRLKAAGADLENIDIVEMVADEDGTERVFSLDKDLPQLQKELESGDYSLVIIDPVMNHIGDVDAYKDQEIRRVLTPLQKLAEKQNVAVVLVAHLNKKSDADLVTRVGGGMGLVGVCRSAWMFTESKDDEGTRLMSSLKTNLTAANENMAFEFESVPVNVFNTKKGIWETQDIGHVVWNGKSKEILTVEHIGFKSKEPSKQKKCETWLVCYMKNGKAFSAKELYDFGDTLGYSEQMVRRAYKNIGGLKPVQTKDGWLWQLVANSATQTEVA